MLIVDPSPEGWRYGFPRPAPPLAIWSDAIKRREWLLSFGYPEKYLDFMVWRYWDDR